MKKFREFLTKVYYKYLTEAERGVDYTGTSFVDRMSKGVKISPFIFGVLGAIFFILGGETLVSFLGAIALSHVFTPILLTPIVHKDVRMKYVKGMILTGSYLFIELFRTK